MATGPQLSHETEINGSGAGAEKSRRISFGTMDEMKRAVGVFRQVLTAGISSRAAP